ncbi:MAG: hypothetical protein ISN29_06265 [Gammaproteobacteria bacterium AqS3]|nr:hypothetical protein [Gammaproteobacteria bacterium AqS3]
MASPQTLVDDMPQAVLLSEPPRPVAAGPGLPEPVVLPAQGERVHALLPWQDSMQVFEGPLAMRRPWQLHWVQRRGDFWFHLLDLDGHPSDWRFAYRICAAESDRLAVMAAAVPAALLERAGDEIAARGWRIERLVPEVLLQGLESDPGAVFGLPPSASLIAADGSRRRVALAAAALAPASALAVYVLWPSAAPPIEQVRQQQPQASVEVSLDDWHGGGAFTAAWPETLGAVLPQRTVLHRYDLEISGRWTLTGAAPDPAELAQLMQALERHQPLLISSVNRQGSLEFEIRGRAP